MDNEIVKKEDMPKSNGIVKVERFANNFDFMPMLASAGQVKLTDEQKNILYAPVNTEDVEMRPEGLIYLPWREYQDRLRKAFGLEYALIPNGNPQIDTNSGNILWGFYLIIQGHMMAYAIGEQVYSGNSQMTWTDACEGAKSNALMRVCKDIGIGTELWKPSFIREWKEKNLCRYEQYKNNKDKLVWRLKAKDTTPKFADINKEVKKTISKENDIYNHICTGEPPKIIETKNLNGKKVELTGEQVETKLNEFDQEAIRQCCIVNSLSLETLEKWLNDKSKGVIKTIKDVKIDQVEKVIKAIPQLAGTLK